MSGSSAETNSGPWKAAAPYIKQTFGAAQNLYNQGAGYRAAPYKDLFQPYSPQTNQAIGGMFGYGQQGNPLAGQSQGAIGGILGSGGGIGTQGQLESLYGAAGPGQNGTFNQAVNYQAGQLTDDINREFSGLGRTGSAAQSGAIADQVGQFRNQALANEYNQEIANQAGILGQIGNVQGQNVANQLSAIGAAPGAYQQGLLPYQTQAMAGSALDAQNQARANAHLNQFNARNNQGWQRLGNYSQLVGGPGGGSQTTYTPGSSPIGGLLGGGLLGGQVGQQIGGQTGAGYGALLGGGLGLAANLFGL